MKKTITLTIITLAFFFFGRTPAASADPCGDKVTLTLNLMEIGGNPLPGFKYELYEQDEDSLERVVLGSKVANGTSNARGTAEISITPDPDKGYALKVYQQKGDIGEYWFYNSVQFHCGMDKTLNRSLPFLKIILRDSSGNLKKNYSFSIYEQTYDVDNRPVKDPKRLVATMKTGENGAAVAYIGTAHPYDLNKRGLYVFSATANQNVFDAYDIAMLPFRNTVFEYVFSDLSVSLRNAAGQPLAAKEVRLYQQTKSGNNLALGTKLVSGKTDTGGVLHLEYPAGTYALAVKDSFNRDAIFWNVVVKDRQANLYNMVLNSTKISATDSVGELLSGNSTVKVYSLYETGGNYYRDKEAGSIKMGTKKLGEVSLAEGPYLATYVDKALGEYGQAFWAVNGDKNTVNIKVTKAQLINGNQAFLPKKPSGNNVSSGPVNAGSVSKRLAGNILLQVEEQGQAWYLNPKDLKRYYLSNGAAAYGIMRSAGIGTTDADLKKIPIGVGSRFAGQDNDGDFLPNGLEVAIGTDPNKSDTDGDGFKDGEELTSTFDPRSGGRITYDYAFANKQKGKILLQVEKNGEAWYVNPKDGLRYYLGDGDLAFQIMRFLSLGITNNDLNSISVGN